MVKNAIQGSLVAQPLTNHYLPTDEMTSSVQH